VSTQHHSPNAQLKRCTPSHTTTRTDHALLVAALGFACATGYNSVVAIRESVLGEPFGIRIPLPVPTGILVGWGSAVAAPWPMPALALLSAARQPGRDTPNRSALICAGIGIAGIVGILIEPNTYRAKSWTSATRRAVVAHVATSLTLAGAGIRHMRRAANPEAKRAPRGPVRSAFRHSRRPRIRARAAPCNSRHNTDPRMPEVRLSDDRERLGAGDR
jgi:hypothetical protein